MNGDSTFGAEPDQIQRLFEIGLNKNESDEDTPSIARWDLLKEKPGSQIGPYLITEVLGEGGMGIVYLAQQKQPISRQVALKVIKLGMDTERVISRFEAERKALALLDHPNIAQVYDAGTTETGRPYFVMEYVDGTSITDYCDLHRLTITERLKLFQQVCQAVQHAHQKGIIHRDIKPSNILVAHRDGDPIPKIIDFGVAKAINQPLTDRTLITEQGQFFGTPEYMSPEQAVGDSEDIDTRSDVYSLGVLLYVLLTGVLPFDPQVLRDSGIENICKMIRENDPKTPSTRLTKLGERAKHIAENRRTQIQTLAKHLKKELEWIPLKALRKERAERYRSASELADDIENYLTGVPLIAGPLTTGYRLRKNLRRHKILVGGIAAVLLVSIIGTLVSANFALGQARDRAEAVRQAKISQAVTSFLSKDILGSIRSVKGSKDVTTDIFNASIAKLLDVASKKLEGKIQDSPAVEAEIRFNLGNAYWGTRGAKAAIPHYARSYELRRELFGERNGQTKNAKLELAYAYNSVGQNSEAERLWKELIETSPSPWWECNLANTYRSLGRYKEAEELFVKNLEADTPWWNTRSWRAKDPNGTPYIEDLARVYLHLAQYDKAEELFNQFMGEQGGDMFKEGEFISLGYIYMAQEKYEKAEDLFTRGIEYCNREFLGKGHPKTLAYKNALAVLHTRKEEYDEAERLFKEIFDTMQYEWCDDRSISLDIHHDFGVLRRKQQRHTEAESRLNKAFKCRQSKLGSDHPSTLETVHELGVLYKEQELHDKAERLLRDAIEGRLKKLDNTHPYTQESIKNLIELYEARNKPGEAEMWRAKLPTDDTTSGQSQNTSER